MAAGAVDVVEACRSCASALADDLLRAGCDFIASELETIRLHQQVASSSTTTSMELLELEGVAQAMAHRLLRCVREFQLVVVEEGVFRLPPRPPLEKALLVDHRSLLTPSDTTAATTTTLIPYPKVVEVPDSDDGSSVEQLQEQLLEVKKENQRLRVEHGQLEACVQRMDTLVQVLPHWKAAQVPVEELSRVVATVQAVLQEVLQSDVVRLHCQQPWYTAMEVDSNNNGDNNDNETPITGDLNSRYMAAKQRFGVSTQALNHVKRF